MLAASSTLAQTPLPQAPSAMPRPLILPGGMVVQRETPGAMPLTLDDAIALGVKSNATVVLAGQQELFVRGQVLTVENALLPTLSVSAYTQAQEIDLAAMGFKPSVLSSISIPGFNLTGFAQIVKVNTTNAQINLSQALTLPALYLFRAAKKATEATERNTQNARGGVVLSVGGYYLRTLADEAQLNNAVALAAQDQIIFNNAVARRDAGVGINLDVLRAQVQLQNQQQQVISVTDAVAKDKIQLNRVMGQPAGQELDLVDTVPFAEYAGLSLEDAVQLAYTRRKDLLGTEAQLQVALETAKAVKYERLPTIGIGGFYGVLGQTTGSYHGDFAAEGKIEFPIFIEGTLRGQREIATAQIVALRQQRDGIRAQIEADIRASLLDVQSSAELVKVARLNQVLAGQELSDASDRFAAGVDDDLPVVEAQAALEGAQAQVIQSEFQYNYAKLQLARNTGVVESEYKQYLGR